MIMRALVVIFVIICAASCTERKRSNSVLRAEAYYVSDDKQFCDCLSTIYPDFKYDRMIKIKYKITELSQVKIHKRDLT